jgi:hypothetical protein
MTMRASTKRLAKLSSLIDAAPVRRQVLREAYEWLTQFGELPDDDHVAYEVVQQALRGGEEEPFEDPEQATRRAKDAAIAYHQRPHCGSVWPPSVRSMLFDEALYEREPVRKLARWMIAKEVAYGGDVESPAFGARHGMPAYGSIAMHVAGWHRRLVVPPYEYQATRLLVRLDNLRGRDEVDDPAWVEEQARCRVAFGTSGVLPTDPVHLEGVLVNVALDLLMAHSTGKDVSEAMALLSRVESNNEAVAQQALVALSEMTKARGLY